MKNLQSILIEVFPKFVKSTTKILLKKGISNFSKESKSSKKKLAKLSDSEGFAKQIDSLPSTQRKSFFRRHKSHIIKILGGLAIEIFVTLIFN